MTQRWALLVAKHTSVTTAHCGTNRLDMSPGPGLLGPPRSLGRAPTSSRSSQWVPLPRKPTGQAPQDQEPSGKLLHSAPGKQGLDRQPSAGREEMARLAATHRAAPRPGAAPSSVLRDASSPTAGAQRPSGRGPRSHAAHPRAGRLHTPTCRAAPHPRHPPTGQLFLLHIWCSLTSPTQSLPPCWGSGLLQTRVRSRIPPAQVTVQADHGDQGLHRPSTGGGRTARSCGDRTCAGTRPGLHAGMPARQGAPGARPSHIHSPGQGGPWQALVSRPLPLQFRPPICGTGELQRRMRVTLPTPQVTEQEDHGDQWLQPPSCRTSAEGESTPGLRGLSGEQADPSQDLPTDQAGKSPRGTRPRPAEAPGTPRTPGQA